MAYWLLKTEPEDYSFDRLLRDGSTLWSGVRNHQAANNLKAMRPGDDAFFYRSVVEPAIVGLVRIAAAWVPDPTDPHWPAVEVVPVRPVPREVPLKAIKAEPRLADLALVRQSRLSVVPVGEAHWRILLAMAGLDS
ncbi:MAG: EVE domain-containing protein [Geminicoccaceae bacterium]|nr:EVE domain-containing protein [Geminicoccaceae bacterium]MCX8101456.1 EVE domain-containing protein [Geminicoccaceae bacterium]MDW8368700.1 EVE domain-containing protein [Geminicoccaceae bacterium]